MENTKKKRIRTTEKAYSTGHAAIELREIEMDIKKQQEEQDDIMTDAEFHAWVDKVTAKSMERTEVEINEEIASQAGL